MKIALMKTSALGFREIRTFIAAEPNPLRVIERRVGRSTPSRGFVITDPVASSNPDCCKQAHAPMRGLVHAKPCRLYPKPEPSNNNAGRSSAVCPGNRLRRFRRYSLCRCPRGRRISRASLVETRNLIRRLLLVLLRGLDLPPAQARRGFINPQRVIRRYSHCRATGLSAAFAVRPVRSTKALMRPRTLFIADAFNVDDMMIPSAKAKRENSFVKTRIVENAARQINTQPSFNKSFT